MCNFTQLITRFQNIDPKFVYGAATLGCAGTFLPVYSRCVVASSAPGLGYLVGPVVGASIWRMTHRRLMRLIEKRDKQFHEHIVKNRVDPTAQSATNPVPDYYGAFLYSLNNLFPPPWPDSVLRRGEDWVSARLQTG